MNSAYIATAGGRGGRFYYYFQIVNAAAQPVANFVQADGKPFLLKYIGDVPKVVFGHLLFIFATVFCVALACDRSSQSHSRQRVNLRPMAVGLFWRPCFALSAAIRSESR